MRLSIFISPNPICCYANQTRRISFVYILKYPNVKCENENLCKWESRSAYTNTNHMCVCVFGILICVCSRVHVGRPKNPLLAVLQAAPKSQLHQTSFVFARLKPRKKNTKNTFDLVDRAAFYGRRATPHNCTHFLLTQFYGDNRAGACLHATPSI